MEHICCIEIWTLNFSFKNTKNYQLNYKSLGIIPKIIEFTKQAYMGPKEAYTYLAKKEEEGSFLILLGVIEIFFDKVCKTFLRYF